MEIITYVLSGAVAHKDSTGTSAVVRPGEVQRMTAGTGVRHSEFNPSATEDLHLLQIWIIPEKRGLQPGYEQKAFPEQELKGKFRLVADREGRDGAVTIHADAAVYATKLEKGESATYALKKDRHAWIHVARGEVSLNGNKLKAGDGVAATEESAITLEGIDAAEVLLFDLA
jgi:redox-sensitive bicupin YhaK (pirin superfamily)